MTRKIAFFDTTLRDGIQAPGNFITWEKRVEVAKALEGLGVDEIEVGFPAVSDYEKKAVTEVAKAIEGTKACFFARCNREDIRVAGEIGRGKSEVELLVCASDILLNYKRRISREENIREMTDSISFAHKYFDSVSVVFEDASRSDLDYLKLISETASGSGVEKIVLADTVGRSLPSEFGALFSQVRQVIPNKTLLSAHCHNDIGLAVANSLAALENGATEVQTTFLGLGERAGNAGIHSILMALIAREESFNLNYGLDQKKVFSTSQKIAGIFAREIPKEAPLIGENVFSTEAGMHQAAVLLNPITYEAVNPSEVGRSRRICIGPFSGRKAILAIAGQLGYHITADTVEKIANYVKSKNKPVTEQELKCLLNQFLNYVNATPGLMTSLR